MTDGTTPPPPEDDGPGFEPLPGYPAFPFRGAPPDRGTAVLDHATEVSLAAWQRALPAEWLPPVLRCADGGSVRLRRLDVFELAEEAHTTVGAFHTYVAAAAWGSRAGREVGRRLRAFTDLTEDDRIRLGQKLAEVTALLGAEGSVTAYRALVHGDQRVPHIRTSFGTKYLYFAGYQRVADGARPLILDRNTALAVEYLTGRTCERRQAPTAVYRAYLNRLHRWAGAWDDCEPDVVERVLFEIGQAPRWVNFRLLCLSRPSAGGPHGRE
jgi:hypothetical protein